MEEDKRLQDWFSAVVAGLVAKPEEVTVEKTVDEQGVLFTLKVSPEDTGKVIGKKGAIAQALRTILRSAGYMQDVRVSMKVSAPNSNFELEDEQR